ncbi:MAG: CRISPR-associated helicase Cas3' [Eubacteriales bacterium]|nr:CRISPR-associated helicase Cas3' [Eubacteriales bacterium]
MHIDTIFFQLAGKSDTNHCDSTKWLPFAMHSTDTACMMEQLCTSWLSASAASAISAQFSIPELQKLCKFLGMVHDIGKLTVRFQSKIGQNLPGHIDRLCNWRLVSQSISFQESFSHALAGQAILTELGIHSGVEVIVGSHHGKPSDITFDPSREFSVRPKDYVGSKLSKPLWHTVWNLWLSIALEYAGYASIDEIPVPGMESQMLLTGLLIMADWLASNPYYFPLIDIEESFPAESSEQRAAYAMSRFEAYPWSAGYPFMDESAFANRFGFLPNNVQCAVLDAVNGANAPGIFILEAQMGVGKTEAALAAAEILAAKQHCGGLFFGLPTQATSNGIFGRLLPWAEQQADESYALYSMKLAHGNAALNEDYQELFSGNATIAEADEYDYGDAGLIAHDWFEGRKKALLANFVVGTVDQLLMASLKQKHVMLRHLGLAGKVSIIDECHAYDAYMNQYLERTLSWLGAYGVPVVILSATLPTERRCKLIDAYCNSKSRSDQDAWRTSRAYPLLTWTDGKDVHQQAIQWDAPGKTVQIRTLTEHTSEIAALLSTQLQDGGCAGIIVNTVKTAQKLAAELNDLLPQDTFRLDLFHSQFLMPDRAERETALLHNVGKTSTPERRNGRIVIGTQVLEQSLDLDFDLLLTELCPMDLLLQRMGRLHRHNRIRPERLRDAQCFLLQPQDAEFDNGTQSIYGD